MTGGVAEACALAALFITLALAVVRPRGLPEAASAAPLAALLIAARVEHGHDAWRAVRALLPTVAFLALILAFGHLCAEVGIFDYLGSLAATASNGSSKRLLVLVVVLASVVAATLTLDATVVLLTPVVLRTARELRVEARPHLYACTELANAGSLLLPVSNLTNLLAFSASGLSFGRFAAWMAAPWLVAIALEWAGLRLFFRDDLAAPPSGRTTRPAAPRYGLAILALTVTGFVVASSLDIAPAWAALGGVVLLGAPLLRRGTITAPRLVIEANPGFVAFVLALGVIVDAVTRHGAGRALSHIVPHGSGFLALLGLACVAALIANIANNLPATLALIPLVSGHPAAVLAVLLGVNIGPNLSYPGSLATLLWRRLLPADQRPRARQFHLYGALSVPVVLLATTTALWASTSV